MSFQRWVTGHSLGQSSKAFELLRDDLPPTTTLWHFRLIRSPPTSETHSSPTQKRANNFLLTHCVFVISLSLKSPCLQKIPETSPNWSGFDTSWNTLALFSTKAAAPSQAGHRQHHQEPSAPRGGVAHPHTHLCKGLCPCTHPPSCAAGRSLTPWSRWRAAHPATPETPRCWRAPRWGRAAGWAGDSEKNRT